MNIKGKLNDDRTGFMRATAAAYQSSGLPFRKRDRRSGVFHTGIRHSLPVICLGTSAQSMPLFETDNSNTAGIVFSPVLFYDSKNREIGCLPEKAVRNFRFRKGAR